MSYKIDKKHYQVRISGSTDEIRNWVKSLEQVITGGYLKYHLKEDLDRLEHIHNPIQFNFNIRERIYFNKESILYGPNASGFAKKFYFDLFVEKHFHQARKLVENSD